MRFTIVPADGLVGVDGTFYQVAMTGIDPAIHAVQYSGASGEIEFIDKTTANQAFEDVSAFQALIDRWQAAHDAATAPPAPLTLTEIKALKIAEIDAASAAAISPITSEYSQAERDTWPIQEAEAVALTANAAAPTPMLTAIAAQRGQTVADVSANVLVKAAAFKTLAGATFGKRRSLVDQVMEIQVVAGDTDAAIAAVQAIVW